MYYIKVCSVVNKGRIKNINCDNVYLCGFSLPESNNGLTNYEQSMTMKGNLTYAVFDGIDGLENGEKASKKATELLKRDIDKQEMVDILKKINQKLSKETPKCGTTATIVSLRKKRAKIWQVGDSPVYLQIGKKFLKIAPQKTHNLLDNYLGSKEDITIDERYFSLKNNDKIIICSDGLANSLTDEQIKDILNESDDVSYITNKLLNSALMNGGKDNISIITLIVKRTIF